MNRQEHTYRNTILTRLLSLLCLLAPAWVSTHAQDDSREIIIACDWDFAPFEFVNIKGEPDGFNIEVLHSILKSLNIPHKFEMKSRRQAIREFVNKKTDLIIDYRGRYTDSKYVRSRISMGFYQIVAAHRPDKPTVRKAKELQKYDGIIANGSNDSIARIQLGSLADSLDLEYHTPREALSGIADGDFNYFIWGEAPLRWKLKEYNLQGIVVDTLDLQSTEIHIVGYDRNLIDEIDSQFARMQQSGEIDDIYDKWFHPENIKEHSKSGFIIFALAVFLAAVIMASIYWMIRKRMKKVLRRNKELEAMMHQALNMGKYAVFIYNIKRNRLTNHHGNILPEEGISMEELTEHIHPDDREQFLDRKKNRTTKDRISLPFTMRWNIGNADTPEWAVVTGYSFPELDEHGRPANIIITAHDISEAQKKEREESILASRYRKMFDTSLVAMSFYDKNGRLVDLNDNMREMIGVTSENEKFFVETYLFDLELVKNDFDPTSKEAFIACQHMDYPNLNIDRWIEFIIRPVLDDEGEILYYVITARNITGERNMYMDLVLQNHALQEATATNNKYEVQMRGLLENCNMYVWHANMDTGIISFSRSLHTEEFTVTLEEYTNDMYEEHRQKALKNIKLIREHNKTFHVVHRFHHTPVTRKPAWFSVSGMPILSADGSMHSLFGIVRDVTELMEAQEQLKEETARAENSAMLKATFLANMTHEIRTPLNAIVGFSDLLHMVNTTEERKEFVHIIRNNCDMLMRLINDIFEASTMDVKPLEIKPEQVDFAQFFGVISQSLAQRVQEPGVEFIVENPYSSFITILDKGRMQQVITNFVTNAVKYTHEGHIRIGYRYTSEVSDSPEHSVDPEKMGIYMYCEDTGTGIPKEKQKKVFERFVKLNDFVQGTGLGLNICKAIAERSNGHIGLDSEGEGHGSTFWIWVPCPMVGTPEKAS